LSNSIALLLLLAILARRLGAALLRSAMHALNRAMRL
jgi:hypothetical protein